MPGRLRATHLASWCVLLFGCRTTHPAPYVPPRPVLPEGPASISDVLAGVEYDHIVQAQAEIPMVRDRFERGLKEGEALFLRLVRPEQRGVREEAIVKVAKWSDRRVYGFAVLEPTECSTSAVSPVLEAFDEAAAIDWIIVRPDGTQEGNRLRYEREERWE